MAVKRREAAPAPRPVQYIREGPKHGRHARGGIGRKTTTIRRSGLLPSDSALRILCDSREDPEQAFSFSALVRRRDVYRRRGTGMLPGGRLRRREDVRDLYAF